MEPNEWVLGAGWWNEVQVINSTTGGKMWIPRQYIGGVSDRYDSVLVVELTKELEYKAGLLAPRVKRVIEMPQEQAPLMTLGERPQREAGRAPVVMIRGENKEDSTVTKALITLGVGAIGVYLLAVIFSMLSRN